MSVEQLSHEVGKLQAQIDLAKAMLPDLERKIAVRLINRWADYWDEAGLIEGGYGNA